MFVSTTLEKISSVALGTSIVVLSFSNVGRAASLYTVTNLVDWYPIRSLGRDINESGVVTGTYGNPGRPISAFRWSSATGLQLLPQPSRVIYSYGNAINDAGIVAGGSLDSVPDTSAVLWDTNGVPQKLPNLNLKDSFFQSAVANDINNRGQVVGQAGGYSPDRAVLWENNQIVNLEIAGEATAINDSSWIVGNNNTTGAFLWKNGQIIDLSDLNTANDINNRGQIVGTSTCGNSTCASIWDNGSLTQFGPDTVAQGINNLGWAVGYEKVSSNDWGQSARLWKNGKAIDLNSLIDPSLGWTLYQATAINNKGQIVGTGKAPAQLGGETAFSAFLLTPVKKPTSVPESTPLLGLAAMGAGLTFYRRHSR